MLTNCTQYKNSDHWLFQHPPQNLPFEFEKSVDVYDIATFAKEKWPIVGGLCFVYYLFIRIGPLWMKNKEPFHLQTSLALWNFLLAVFSIVGTFRTAPTTFSGLSQPNGFYTTFCERNGISQPTVFWGFAFAVSKIFEFGDTAFIILRKKQLSFLHWFHHLTVCFLTFIALLESEPTYYFLTVVNYLIHSIMYTYYTLMALKISLPKKVAVCVTTLQVTQFIVLLSINFYTLGVILNGGKCARSWTSFLAQTPTGVIYLILFIQVFYNSYIVKNNKTKTS